MTNPIIEFLDKKGGIDGLHEFGFVRLLVELDQEGWPVRELGIDAANNVAHKFPGMNKGRETYSLFSDGPIVNKDGSARSSTVGSVEFESYWNSQ